MIIVSRIVFTTEDVDWINDIYRTIGLRTSKSWSRSATLPISDERYNSLLRQLTDKGIPFREHREKKYEPSELSSAEYLDMHPAGYWGYPQPEDGYRSQAYDPESRCEKCGVYARQVRPFRINGVPRMGKNDIIAMNWTYEFIVTERLRLLIQQDELQGAEFWTLVNSSSDERIPGYYQLFVTGRMEAMSRKTAIVPNEPPMGQVPRGCRHLGYMLKMDHELGVHVPIIYERSALRHVKDFNLTHEWLGYGHDAGPMRIVSHRVYDLFSKNKITNVRFEPVIVED